MKNLIFLSCIFFISTSCIAQNKNSQWAVSFSPGVSNNLTGLVSNVRSVRLNEFRSTNSFSLSYTDTIHENFNLEYEIMYINKGSLYTDYLMGLDKNSLFNISQPAFVVPVSFEYHFDKWNVSVGPTVSILFSGSTYIGHIDTLFHHMYPTITDRLVLGMQFKSEFIVIRSNQRELSIEPKVLFDLDVNGWFVCSAGLKYIWNQE